MAGAMGDISINGSILLLIPYGVTRIILDCMYWDREYLEMHRLIYATYKSFKVYHGSSTVVHQLI